jgi:signal transduction histidine kinase
LGVGHHGGVGVVRPPGRGSAFWFTLPLADAARDRGPEQSTTLPE